MKNTRIISAFPACGKTYCFNNKEKDISILDSDSSKFSWIYPEDCIVKHRNPDFPKNYIEHIKENIGKVDYIFVSTHEEVRKALKEAGLQYTLVFPDKSLKAEWIGRCFLRGSGEEFCRLIADQWDNWMAQLFTDAQNYCDNFVILDHGEYLADALKSC